MDGSICVRRRGTMHQATALFFRTHDSLRMGDDGL
jgi:hypothetical protein